MDSIVQSPASKPVSTLRRYTLLALSRSGTYFLLSAASLLIDILSGPLLLFPVLFIVPVALSAWLYSARLAYFLAVALPLARLLIPVLMGSQAELAVPFMAMVANCLIRIVVLLFIAYLVGRVTRYTKELEQRIEDLVTICAWTHTVEYEGEWLTFDQFLRRRFGIKTSHGMSPQQASKTLCELEGHKHKT